MLTIYHAAGTRSMRVIWLCHELDLPLTIETVPFTAEFRASDEWRAKSPSGKVPAMEDDGLVTVSDMLLVLSDFGCVGNCPMDINGDGSTNVTDVLLVLSAFGTACN